MLGLTQDIEAFEHQHRGHPQVGALINTSNAFNDRGWVVRDVFWLQRFNDGKLRVLVGRADTSDYVGQQPMQNVNAQFVNRSFSANPTVPRTNSSPPAAASATPIRNSSIGPSVMRLARMAVRDRRAGPPGGTRP